MLLIVLLAVAAFGLASVVGFFSVIGLGTTYAGSFGAVVALGCAIEYGKLTAVSFLYRFWSRISILFRLALIIMILVVMVITSLGAFGFLTKVNQTDMVGLKQTTVTQQLLAEEEQRLAARKLQIDQQIAQLRSEDVAGRIRLNRQFRAEINEINTRLPLIAKEKATLSVAQITQQADIGPLVYLAKSMGLEIDVATTWFTLLLVIVLDPFAIMLTICTNIAIAAYKKSSITPSVSTPVQPLVDAIRFHPDTKKFEKFDGTTWSAVVDPIVETPIDESGSVEQDTSTVLTTVAENLSTVTLAPTEPEPSTAFPTLADSLIAHPVVEVPDPAAATAFPAVVDSLLARSSATAPLQEVTDTHEVSQLTEDSAESLVELMTEQSSISHTEVLENEGTNWADFTDVSNKIANNRDALSQAEFANHLRQLQAYVDELGTRTETLSSDEMALRSRILTFIDRHQST